MTTTDSFCATMGERYAHLFKAFYEHPFLRGLADGTASRERVLHYVGQDNRYLTAYLRCYGLGASRSTDRDQAAWFKDGMAFLLEDETHPHHVLCAAFGVGYDEVQIDRMAPTAQAYVNHMLVSGHDSLGVLVAALMPCPWTYIWAAQRQMVEDPVAPDNPFRGWWEFYADRDCDQILREFTERLDTLAATAGPAELARMERAFEESCHHEIRFWQMAWTQEVWEDTLALVPQPV